MNNVTERRTPRIILIGGEMTVDEGLRLDSRQVVEGDSESTILHRAMSTSAQWWHAAVSVVSAIRASDPQAFAMVSGARTISEFDEEGNVRRTRLRSILPGGTSKIRVVRVDKDEPLPSGYLLGRERLHGQEVFDRFGFMHEQPAKPWRYVADGEYYSSHVTSEICPTVLVETNYWHDWGDGRDSEMFNAFEQSTCYDPSGIVIVPHTSYSDSFLRRYVTWVEEGRPSPPIRESDWNAEILAPKLPPDPRDFTSLTIGDAKFGITGYLDCLEWKDPSHLEAARALLQSRYDLKVGFWDLASNPTLQQVLLASAKPLPPPVAVGDIPVAARKRADSRVAKRISDKKSEEELLDGIAEEMSSLTDGGWESMEGYPGVFQVQLTGPYHHDINPGESETTSLVALQFKIIKRRSAVTVRTAFSGNLYAKYGFNLGDYLLARQEVFETIAQPASAPVDKWQIWAESGGWADDADWAGRAARLLACTPQWSDNLSEMLEITSNIAAELPWWRRL